MKGLETLLITTCEKIKRDESYLARVASDIAEIGQSECKLFIMHIISGGMVLQVNYGWICMDWLPILAKVELPVLWNLMTLDGTVVKIYVSCDVLY